MIDRKVHLRFARWLAAHSGCSFAASFSMRDSERMFFMSVRGTSTSIRPSQLESLDAVLDGCAAASQAVVVVFPDVARERDLCELIGKLCSTSRWSYSWSDDPDRGFLVDLSWTTADGLSSRTMGLAPLLTMPVTRRSPWPAVALWPGSPRKSEAADVGFIDMPSGLDRKEHRAALAASTENVASLLGEDPAGAPWRSVTYALGPVAMTVLGNTQLSG